MKDLLKEYETYTEHLGEFIKKQYRTTNMNDQQVIQSQPTSVITNFILIDLINEVKELRKVTEKLVVEEDKKEKNKKKK